MKRWFLAWLLITLFGPLPLYPQSVQVKGRAGQVGVIRSHQAAPGVPEPLVITTANPMPDGTEQVAYSQALTVTGGTAPYVWTLESGSLPSPLTLSSGGVISGTPTVNGTYTFTVRVTDAQPAFTTKVLAITLAPATPSAPLFEWNGDSITPNDFTSWNSQGGCLKTATGLIDATHEVTKDSATVCVWNAALNKTQIYGSMDFQRALTGGCPTTGTNLDRVMVGRDSGGTDVFSFRIEDDCDLWLKVAGQTTSFNRGFFLGTPAAGVTTTIDWRWKVGTGSNAELDVRVNGGIFQSYTAGTAATNLDNVAFIEANDNTGKFAFDRLDLREGGYRPYTPPVPQPPPPPTNCFNAACADDFTFTTGADRLGYCEVISEGVDRDPSGVSCSVDGALTEVGTGNDANGVQTTLWVKLGITPGVQTCTASFPGGSDEVEATIGCDTKTGVSSATAEATASNSTASGTSLISSINTASTDPVILAAIGGSLNGTATWSSGGSVELFDSPGGQTPTPGMFGSGAYRLNSGAPGARNMNVTITGGPMAITFFGAAFPIVTAQQGTLLTSYGTVCTGAGDDGPEIETAFADRANWINNTLIFPAAATCLVNEKLTGLGGKSGFTIEGNGSTIKAANALTTADGTALLHISSANNFTVNNLDLDGNRANRNVCECGGGDNLRLLLNTHDVTIRDMDSINGANDGVRVAGESTQPANITFIDSKFSNAYRNNASVIEGFNIRFTGNCSGTATTGTCTCQFTGANGTAPESGIDWEPNIGSPNPAITDGLVDGCLIADNNRSGFTNIGFENKIHNMTVRNSIIRNNGLGGVRGGVFTIGGYGSLFEDNLAANSQTTRFCEIWVAVAGQSQATPFSAARKTSITSNDLTGTPGLSVENGSRRWVCGGNYCDGVLAPCANSASATNNAMTNIGVSASGDWCAAGNGLPAGNVSGNTVDVVTQVPNPGCP